MCSRKSMVAAPRHPEPSAANTQEDYFCSNFARCRSATQLVSTKQIADRGDVGHTNKIKHPVSFQNKQNAHGRSTNHVVSVARNLRRGPEYVAWFTCNTSRVLLHSSVVERRTRLSPYDSLTSRCYESV